MTAHFLTASAAAKVLGVSINRIDAWIAWGLLPAKKSVVAIGSRHQYWQIQLVDLNRFRVEHSDLIACAHATKLHGGGYPKGYKPIKREQPNAKPSVALPADTSPVVETWDLGQDAWKKPEPVAGPTKKKRTHDQWATPIYEGGGRVAMGRY
jgi:hypothetical protein